MSGFPSPLMSPTPTPCAGHGPGPETLTEIHGPRGFAGSGCENDTPAPLLLTTSGLPSPSMSLNAVISPPPSMPVAIRSQRRTSLPGLMYSVVPMSTSGHPSPVQSNAYCTSRLLGYELLGFQVWLSRISRETVKSGPRKYHGPATMSSWPSRLMSATAVDH